MKISELLGDIAKSDLVLPVFRREYLGVQEQAKQLMVKKSTTASVLILKADDQPDIKDSKIAKERLWTTKSPYPCSAIRLSGPLRSTSCHRSPCR